MAYTARSTQTTGHLVTASEWNEGVNNDAFFKANSANITTGTYTGDGTESQSITGVGFEPKYVKIWPRETGSANDTVYETTDTIIDDNATNDQSWRHLSGGGHDTRANKIISLDSDGFTVDDAGADNHPNANGQVYNYVCIGLGL